MTDGGSERIVRAANRHLGIVHSVPAPGRHADVIRAICDEGLAGPDDPVECTGGFLTSNGRFVDRGEAWVIAEQAGQLLPGALTSGGPGQLFSEDVW